MNQYIQNYVEKKTVSQRNDECVKIRRLNPFRVPVILNYSGWMDVDHPDQWSTRAEVKHRFLFPQSYTVARAIEAIRSKIPDTECRRASEETFFVYPFWCGKKHSVMDMTILRADMLLEEAYAQHKHHDGYLYLTLQRETVFG